MLAFLLASCGSLPAAPGLPSGLPESWPSAPLEEAAEAAAPDLRSWWKAFGDAMLDELVDRALAQNLTLAQARSRWMEARRLGGAEGRKFLPALDAGVHTVQDSAAIDNYLHGSLEVSWELGLFGRQAAVDQGIRAGAQEAIAAEQAARVSVVAELVHHYLALRAAQAESGRLLRLAALDDRILELHAIRERHRLGSVEPRQAVLLRRAQTEAAQAAPRGAAAGAAQAIAVLLGQTTADARWTQPLADESLPVAPLSFRLAQVPADLLRFRPDVRQAEAEVGRATSELGLARAALYPRVTLGLAYVYAYNLTQNRRNSVNSDLPAFGLGVDVPLFDWGRRRAVADAREEALRAAVLGYRQALVSAYGDTEVALDGYAAARERADRLAGAERLVGQRMNLQATRERLGLASRVDRLEGERAALQLRGDRAEALAACSQAFVRVYKALGGAPLAEIGETPLAQIGEPPLAEIGEPRPGEAGMPRAASDPTRLSWAQGSSPPAGGAP